MVLVLGSGQSLEEFGGTRESLHCHEWPVKSDSCEGSEEEESCRESFSLLREYLGGGEHSSMLVEIWTVQAILRRSRR